MAEEYKWGTMSPNDPSPVPLKYHTREEAEQHAKNMTDLAETWESNEKNFWNKDHWKVKPMPWIVKELPW